MTQTSESREAPHPAGNPATDSVVEFINVTAQFPTRQGYGSRRRANMISAVDDVSFTVRCGTTFGLVGESGCGKSTVAGLIMGLARPTAGRILVNGRDLKELTGADLSAHRRATQIVLQDPYSSLDPRMKVRHIIAEPLTIGRAKPSKQRLNERIDELLGQVGLPPNCADLYPHQFSGGQRQRIAIARALAPEPRLIVLDEPTSGLDVSVRAQVLNMLKDLQSRLGLTYVYISHDLASVAYMATTTAVMYLGRIVENGPSALLHNGSSMHPYTKLLLAAVPTWEKNNASVELATDDGDVPSSASVPPGCAFHPRCALRANLGNPARCRTEQPEIREYKEQHWQACHFVAGGSSP